MRSNASGRTTALLLAGVCLLPTLLVGCRGGNARRMEADLYQRELRLQEDEIYRLEDYLEEYQAIVRGYRCEVEELKRELEERGEAREEARATRPTAAKPSPTPTPAPIESDTLPEPDDLIEMPSADEAPAFTAPAATDASEAPAFEPAPLYQPDAEPLPAPIDGAAAPAADAPGVTLAAGEAPTAEPATPPLPYPHSPAKPIADAGTDVVVPTAPIHLAVRREATEAKSSGTLVAVVTESETGWLAAFRGEASLMLTDPAANGKQRRLARWDFSASEVESAWVMPDEGPLQLELPISLPAGAAGDADTRLWVRLVDDAGHKTLQATPLGTETPDRLARATPLAPPRRLPDVQPTVDAREPIAANTEADAGGWRRAIRGRRPRRLDPAVTAAAHFIEAETGTAADE